MKRFDVAIVGSGFAGSILARALHRRGRRVLLVERGRHPRFALGESTTPLANFALERLAARYDLPDLHQLSSHGRWLAGLPHLRRGLKRGFTFFHHRRGERFSTSPRNESRLLVAASPHDHVADTHWLRRDVDHHLVRRAIAEGVVYCDETELTAADFSPDGVRLEARRQGEALRFDAGVVVDGSGAGGFLARALPIASRTDRIPFASGLLYAHFEGVEPFPELPRLTPGPYPDERAAVHHLLDFGWMYVLPFDHGTVSAGLILRGTDGAGRPRNGADLPPGLASDPAGAWHRLLALYPSLAAQFAGARPVTPIRYVGRMQHRLARAAGPRWFLLPHAYAFFDPLFSTGMAWSLLAVEQLAELLTNGGDDGRRYARRLAAEADQIERLIDAAYLAAGDFELFVAVSFLYFAVVSFAEAAHRLLAVPPTGGWFLGAGDRELRSLFEETRTRLRRLAAAAEPPGDGARAFGRWMLERLEPFDVVGLGDPGRANLYPVDLDVLVDRAHLLGLEREDLKAALPRLRGEEDAGGEENTV